MVPFFFFLHYTESTQISVNILVMIKILNKVKCDQASNILFLDLIGYISLLLKQRLLHEI